MLKDKKRLYHKYLIVKDMQIYILIVTDWQSRKKFIYNLFCLQKDFFTLKRCINKNTHPFPHKNINKLQFKILLKLRDFYLLNYDYN